MTSPAGGNDDVVRYVFQAVADYGQLLRETRQAREETRALKADIDGLAGTTTHRVKVTADTGQARSELARVFQDIAVKIKVTVDAVAANAELQRLLRDVKIKAKLVIDGAAARAELGRVVQQFEALRQGVRIRVDVDVDAARAKLERLMRDTVINVEVHPDTTRLVTELTALLRDRAVQIAVALDEHGVTERFRALLAHLESMGPVVISVELHEGILDRIEAAADRLRRLRDDVQGGGGGPGPDPAPSPSPGGGGGGKGPIPEGLSSAASMVAGWGSLIAAAVPVAAALTVGVGTIAASFVAAGAGAGIFAVAAVGAIGKVTDAVKAYEKSGTITKGPVGQAVDEFEQLKGQYGELQKATQTDVMAVFVHGLQIAEHLLTRVQPLISTFAHAVDEALSQVDDKVTGGGLQKFLDFVGRVGPHAIQAFTTGLLGFVGGLGGLIMAFEPFVRTFVDGFARIGQEFSAWAAGLGTDQQFQEFVTYAIAQVPRVIEFLENLVKAAADLVVALAPIGGVVLSIANAAVRFIAALPPGVLTAIIGAVLGLAVAIKVLQGAMVIEAFFTKFTGSLARMRTAMGGAAGGAGGLKGALGGLGAALAITAGVIVLNNLLDKLADQQNEAADAATRHQDALSRLGKQLAAGKDLNSPEVRGGQYEKLMGLSAEGKAGGVFGHGETKETVNLRDLAKQAGVSGDDLVTGSLGVDPKTQSQNLGKLEAYRRSLLAKAGPDQGPAKDVADALTGSDRNSLLARADAIEKLETQVEAESTAVGEAAAAAKGYTDAQKGATAADQEAARAAQGAAGAYNTQANAHTALLAVLAKDYTSDARLTAVNNAISAMDAYKQQQVAVADAERELSDAQYQAKQAQLAVNDARLAAVQRIKDVQRALRDMTLDERQGKLNVKQADQNLAKLLASGGTTDQIEQAQIDDERAHNALNDLQQDKGPKKTALDKELAAGVNGNKALQDAVRQNTQAQTALKTANTNLGTASRKLTELHLAFQAAAGAVGLSEGQIKTLATNMDKLKDKTVKVTVNTKDAEEKLRRLAQGEIAIRLMAANPGWDYNRAYAEAAKEVPTLATAADKKNDAALKNRQDYPKGSTGYAEGGPTVASAVTAGAVYGPGTGTSDNIAVRLPVGGGALVSPGEHIVTDAEVRSAPGGHGYLEAFRAGLRAGRPWAPPAQRGYAAGGAAAPPVRAGWVPAFGMPTLALAAALPGYAAGGAVAAATAGGTVINRSVSISGVTITNAVPETASTSLYRMVRRAVDGEVA